VTVCPALADGAPAATNPPTSRRRARAVLVPVTSARAGTARRLHRLGGGAHAAARDGLRDGRWISDVPHVLAQRGRLPRGRGGGRRTTVGVRVVRQPRHPLAHTEVSDRKIADLLTSKKNSPVIYVPQLAEVPPGRPRRCTSSATASSPNTAVRSAFRGTCSPPRRVTRSTPPLRSLELVTWKNPRSARELTAAADVLAEQKAGEPSLTSPGIVINMPFLAWPSGHR